MAKPNIALLPRLVANRLRPAREVELPEASVALPAECANCGELGGQFVREVAGSTTLLIPYCAPCAQAVARGQTDQFAAMLASVMLIITLLLTLPRVFVELNVATFCLLVAGAGALPVLMLWATRRPFSEPRSSGGKAAFLRDGRHLVCFNAPWGQQLAASLSGKDAVATRRREPRISGWMWSSSLLGLALAPSVYTFNYPDVVVLNFGDQDVNIVVDGRRVGSAEPTSLESEQAGTRLRIATGRHRVTAVARDGRVLEQFEARLEPGALHLMTVAGDDYCFWLEENHYGRVGPDSTRRRSLDASEPLWVVPARIDSWFSPNPAASGDERSSGGTMTALRHAPCKDLPAQGND